MEKGVTKFFMDSDIVLFYAGNLPIIHFGYQGYHITLGQNRLNTSPWLSGNFYRPERLF